MSVLIQSLFPAARLLYSPNLQIHDASTPHALLFWFLFGGVVFVNRCYHLLIVPKISVCFSLHISCFLQKCLWLWYSLVGTILFIGYNWIENKLGFARCAAVWVMTASYLKNQEVTSKIRRKHPVGRSEKQM